MVVCGGCVGGGCAVVFRSVVWSVERWPYRQQACSIPVVRVGRTTKLRRALSFVYQTRISIILIFANLLHLVEHTTHIIYSILSLYVRLFVYVHFNVWRMRLMRFWRHLIK